MKHFDIVDHDLLIRFLEHEILEKSKKESVWAFRNGANLIMIILKYKKLLRNKSLNKSNCLEMMFIEMREASR